MSSPGAVSIHSADRDDCAAPMCSEKLFSKKDAAKWLLKHHPDQGGEPASVDVGLVADCMGKKHFCASGSEKGASVKGTRKVTSDEQHSLSRVFQKAHKPASRGPETIVNAYQANAKQLQCVRHVSNWAKIGSDNRFNKKAFDVAATDKLIPIASPKLEAMLQNIEALDKNDMTVFGKTFKHFIFSDIKLLGYGAKIIGAGLLARGWNNILKQEIRKTRKGNQKAYIAVDVPKGSAGRNFAILSSTPVWSAPFSQALKKEVLRVYNKRPDNVYGEECRLIVLDSGFKEGIDLFDVRYVHLFEPLMTAADLTQALGRATRLCGQKGLDFVPQKGWPLHVFKYSQSIPESLQPSFKAQNMFEIMLQLKGLDTRLHKITKCIQDVSILAAVDQPLTEEIHKSGLLPKMNIIRSSARTGEGSIESVFTQTVSNMSNHFSRADFMNSKAKSVILLEDAKAETGAESLAELESGVSEDRCAGCSQASIVPFLPSRLSHTAVTPSVVVESNMLVVREPALASSKASSRVPTNWFDLRRYISNNFNKMAWGKQEVANKCLSGGSVSVKVARAAAAAAATKKATAAAKKVGTKKKSTVGLPALKLVDYTPTQDFVSSYFTIESPIKGMLLWHSVGTGKTCTAIALASKQFEPAGYTILWVTRHTLKIDIWKNIFEQVCHKAVADEVRAGKLKPTDVEKRKKKMFQMWIPPMSYRQFSNLVSKKNPLYKVLVARNGAEDPLKKTLIIIDEAHKLYSSDFKGAEKPDVPAFSAALQNSYAVSKRDSARVLLMTATPYNESPMELMSLLNLCREKKAALPENIPDFVAKYMDNTGNFSKEGVRKYMDDVAGQISYLNREADPSQFAQPIFADIVVPISTYDMVDDGGSADLTAGLAALDVEEKELNEKTIPYLEAQLASIKPAQDSHLRECLEKFSKPKEKKECQKRVTAEYKAAIKQETKNLKDAQKRSLKIGKERVKLEKKHKSKTKKLRQSGPSSFTQQAQFEGKCKLGAGDVPKKEKKASSKKASSKKASNA